MGEEWRKGWHPEYIPEKDSDSSVLIVGSGPAGLEAAVALGKRGYQVTLTDSRRQLGGRVLLESGLPGLAQWSRVADWRLTMIGKLPNIEYYLESELDEAQILEFDADHVVVATGAKWRHDGVGRWREYPIPGCESPHVITPDDLFAGAEPEGPVVVYDDEHYYMGGVVAEKLRRDGWDVTLLTPANEVSTWTRHTEEQFRIQQRLLGLSVGIETGTTLARIASDHAVLESIYSENRREVEAATVVMVTSRTPQDHLYHSLAGTIVIDRIGDCLAPGTIATAVYSGHRFAREFDASVPVPVPFLRDSRAI